MTDERAQVPLPNLYCDSSGEVCGPGLQTFLYLATPGGRISHSGRSSTTRTSRIQFSGGCMFQTRKLTTVLTQLALMATLTSGIEAAKAGKMNGETIKADDLREWLGYIASDDLEGRATFSEGLGLAAAYIAGQLKSWGVKPGGPNGSYFQRVAVLGVKSNNRSTLTRSE